MTGNLDIIDRLKLLARGDNLDLVDLVCQDAISEIKRLRDAKRRALALSDERAKEVNALRSAAEKD